MHVTKTEINPLHVPVQKYKKMGKKSTLIHQEISFELCKLVSNTPSSRISRPPEDYGRLNTLESGFL